MTYAITYAAFYMLFAVALVALPAWVIDGCAQVLLRK